MEMCSLSDCVSKNKKRWKISYGQKYFKSLEFYKISTLMRHMRKNFIYFLLTHSGLCPRMGWGGVSLPGWGATFGVDAFKTAEQ